MTVPFCQASPPYAHWWAAGVFPKVCGAGAALADEASIGTTIRATKIPTATVSHIRFDSPIFVMIPSDGSRPSAAV